MNLRAGPSDRDPRQNRGVPDTIPWRWKDHRTPNLEPQVQRLRKGQEWLTRNYDRWWKGQLDNEYWWEAFDTWDRLDLFVRAMGFQGYPIPRGCDPNSPISCRACGSPRQRDGSQT